MTRKKKAQLPPEWTASRCTRLLRPITSQLPALRATASLNTQQLDTSHGASRSGTRTQNGQSPASKDDPDWMAAKPKKTFNRQYARFAGSLGPTSEHEATAGTITLDTPLVSRLRKFPTMDVNERKQDQFRARTRSDWPTKASDSESMSGKDTWTADSQSRNLCKATFNLIQATNDCKNEEEQRAFFPTSGARSLRAMCTRGFAREIVELDESQYGARAEEKFDIVNEAYDLAEETIGDLIGGEYMRAIVRQHGVLMSCKFVSKALITRNDALTLIRYLKFHTQSHYGNLSSTEIESIGTALIQTPSQHNNCCEKNNLWGHTFNNLAYVSVLVSPVVRVGCDFRLLDKLITSVIPTSWLGTRQMTALWKLITTAFVDVFIPDVVYNTNIRDATKLLTTLLSLDSGTLPVSSSASAISRSNIVPDYFGTAGCPRCPHSVHHATIFDLNESARHLPMNHVSTTKRLSSTLNNSFASVLQILASFFTAAIMDPDEAHRIDSQALLEPIISLLGNLSMIILLRKTSARSLASDFPFARSISTLATTLVVLLVMQGSGMELSGFSLSVNDLVRELIALDKRACSISSTTASASDSLSEIVYAIARGAGKLLNNDGFIILHRIITSFRAPDLTSSTSNSTRAFLAETSASSSQNFADRIRTDEASDLAAELNACSDSDETLRRRTHQEKIMPRIRHDREGLRWEESICEFIRSSPHPKSIPRLYSDKLKSATYQGYEKEIHELLGGDSTTYISTSQRESFASSDDLIQLHRSARPRNTVSPEDDVPSGTRYAESQSIVTNSSSNLKRKRSEDHEEDPSDDELSLPHKGSDKRTKGANTKKAEAEIDGEDVRDDDGEVTNSSHNGTDIPTSTVPGPRSRRSGAFRRNPRGTVLHSLLSMQASSIAPQEQNDPSTEESSDRDELDDQDELKDQDEFDGQDKRHDRDEENDQDEWSHRSKQDDKEDLSDDELDNRVRSWAFSLESTPPYEEMAAKRMARDR